MKHMLGNFRDRSVCMVGLGYVGLTLAVAMADAGFDVMGVEIRDQVLEGLLQGKPHFHEPGLEAKLQQQMKQGSIHFSKYIPEQWRGSTYIITVGTPLGSDGKSRIDMIENVSREVASHIQDDDIIIMRSTVKLNTTRNNVMPILKKSGKRFDLAFCPERTLEGRALVEIRALPQIVGGIDIQSTVRAAQIFQYLTSTVVRVNSIETAEMIKLVDNTNRDVQFAYANEVARICDTIGISAREVIEAGKLGYPRTGLPMPGPVGGPCLEKDPYILAEGLTNFHIEPEITMMARYVNERQPKDTITAIEKDCRSRVDFPLKPRIALLGLAFKGRPETDDLRGTMARPIYKALRESFPQADYVAYDPVVTDDTIRTEFGATPMASLEQAFEGTHLVVILNNHPIFSAMPVELLAESMAKPGLIYDYWNGFNANDLHLPTGIYYGALGSYQNSIRQRESV